MNIRNSKYRQAYFAALPIGGILCLILLNCGVGQAQDATDPNRILQELMRTVAHRHPQLQTQLAQIEAQKVENLKGLTPPDPRVGMNYLRPKPRLSDQRLDLSVSQAFEFPSLYGQRKRLAQSQNEALTVQGEMGLRKFQQDALQTWLEYLYWRQAAGLRRQQEAVAERLFEAIDKAYQAGEQSGLDRERARLHLAAVQQEVRAKEQEAQVLLDELRWYNGGQEWPDLGDTFPVWEMLTSEGQHALGSLTRKWHEQDLEVAKLQEKVAGNTWLPDFEIGYMREQDIDVAFQGLTLGLRIPLWQQKNQLKSARLQSQARRAEWEEVHFSLNLKAQQLASRAEALKTQVNEWDQLLAEAKGPAHSLKALELGEWSLSEYLLEQVQFYELQEKRLEVNLQYQLTQAERWIWFGL